MRHAVRARRPWKAAAAVGVAAVTMIVVAAAAAVHTVSSGSGDGPVDMQGRRVQPDLVAPVRPGGSPGAPDAQATPDGGGRFTVPSTGLDVPLGSLTMTDNVVNPPGFTSAYRVRNLGVPVERAGRGTVFVVMHSLHGGGVGPGNYLIDVDAGRSRLEAGAVIGVAGTDFRVTRAWSIGKDRIDRAARVWENVPGRLVVITCLQRPDGGRSTDNVVIEAVRRR